MNQSEKKCVLVVDDQAKVLKFIEIDLRMRGYEVITTTSGREALKLVKSKNPDIMLLDIIMPEMDGLEVLKELRNFPRLPVIAFSASPGGRNDALHLGADDFIIKPFRSEEMVRKIEALLNR